ncbi:MAG: hypothetical protein AAF823_03475 [Planctomycetota bacterium]
MSVPEPSSPPPRPTSDAWPQTVRWVAIVFLIVAGLVAAIAIPSYLAYLRAGDLLSVLQPARIHTQIVAHVDRTLGTTRLQLVERSVVEQITRTSERTLFRSIELPDVVTSVRVPVTYTFTTDVAAIRAIDLDDATGVLTVVMDPLGWNPPAADVSAMAFEQRGSWLRLDESDEMETLRSSITELLDTRAAAHAQAVREEARRQAEAFLAAFFDEHRQTLGTEEVAQVQVRFADELEPDEANATAPTAPEPATPPATR